MQRIKLNRRPWNALRSLLAPAAFVFVVALAASPLSAQIHKVAKPDQVVRAVGVYEWTGDMAKPTASRLVPISLFINSKLEDAGVYLARPVPFSLDQGNVYEIDEAGLPKGTLTLSFSRHFVPVDTATTSPFDDGWFGYGRFAPPAAVKQATLRPSKTLAAINNVDRVDDDSDRPHFSSKSAQPGTGGSAGSASGKSTTSTADAPPDDPDRPTMHRAGSSGSGSGSSSSSAPSASSSSGSASNPPADPDRPTMHRRTDSSSDQTASSDSKASGDSSSRDSTVDDPDRPTLRRRSPEEAKKAKDQAAVTNTSSLNDDPNRPMIHRGRPAGMATEEDLPKLTGLPGDVDLHQMVAVSDAATRPDHNFALAWDSEAQHQTILAQMQTAAREQLKAYEIANGLAPKPAPVPPASKRPNSKLRQAKTPDSPPAPPEPLMEEQLKAYMLSYGGSPTYVYSAHTDGLGPALCFVTVVAQVDMQSTPQVVLKSVTDATHLDRTPRMRLIDVVDADASNRASLLFELRSQNARQFTLYRVIGARADQIFLTGTTQ